jgi:hypothetical protein
MAASLTEQIKDQRKNQMVELGMHVIKLKTELLPLNS